MSTIRFQIVPPIAHCDEPILITGNLPVLGDWDPGRALPLRWQPPYHVGEAAIETGTHFEYKILRGSWENEAVDAYGNVPGNESHEVWLDATLHHTVADWKDRYRGRLTHERIFSRSLAGHRDLLIWLPQSYATHPCRRFPVLILHDGANVFDPRTSPLSGVDWAADEWVSVLADEGVMPEAIVVGICHPEGFSEENETLRDFDLSPELGGAAYAQFVADELPAFLDTHYRTQAKPTSRILGGSSLGGLITLYIAIHHPGVFGRYLCLSPLLEDLSSRPPTDAGILRTLEMTPFSATGVRLSIDHGDTGRDANTVPYLELLKKRLLAQGWREGRHFILREIPGGQHDELSWRLRLGDALRFLVQGTY